jgi:hypothetical protein
MPDPATTWTGDRYYAVHVVNSGKVSLHWSEPFADRADARVLVRQLLADGQATMGFVVRALPNGARRLVSVHPPSAQKIIDHYRDLLMGPAR